VSTRISRAADAIGAAGADALLLADPGAVAWITGHAVPLLSGPSPFAIGAVALVERDASVRLFAPDDDEVQTGDGVEVELFTGYGMGPLDRLTAVRGVLAPHLAGRRLALDAAAVPVGLATAAASWVDASQEILVARAVKDADELVAIREAIATADAGHAAVRAALRPGATELELWNVARAAMDERAGAPVLVMADMVSGTRTAAVGGPATSRTIADGELVLCDLAPRPGAYWGDSCATMAVGEPSPWAVDAHRRARETLEAAVAAIRPGITGGELDRMVRERLGDLPHHVGHGIGGSAHELPRIVPGSDTVLEPGMVVAVEPGVYGEREGVRVEVVVVVEPDGCSVLSGHDLEL
jgi:Xaa-Pro aminopeptidase/Xaa-Pro dipeptidase